MSHIQPPVPATAIEVVAQLGNSIVSTRHVTATAPRRSPWMPAAIGAGLLLLTLALAAHVLSVTNHNTASLATWLAAKRPMWAFRPSMVSLWIDWAMPLTALGSLSMFGWALLRWQRAPGVHRFAIGGAHSDLPIDGIEMTEVVTATQQGLALSVARFNGSVQRDGAAAAAFTASTFVANKGDHATLEIGAMTLHLTGVDAPAHVVGAPGLTRERAGLLYFAGAALGHVALLFLAMNLGLDATAGGTDADDNEPIRMVSLPDTTNEDLVAKIDPDQGDVGGQTAGGTLMKLAPDKPTGAEGGNDAKLPPGAKGNSTNAEARASAIDAASRSGILSAITNDRMAALIGDTFVDADGLSNSGLFGGVFGEGGDGTGGQFGSRKGGGGGLYGGPGTGVKVGGFNTIGDGNRAGQDWGNCIDCPPGKGRHHAPVAPNVKFEPPQVEGDYDKALIKRAMKMNQSKISYCYEKALLAQPDLNGTVMVEFALHTPTGRVLSSKARGVDPEVAQCIAGIISTISFPTRAAMAGGELINVKYPFSLRIAK